MPQRISVRDNDDDTEGGSDTGGDLPGPASRKNIGARVLQEADVPSSRPVRDESALGSGVGGGAWGPQDDGSSMAVDPVTDMAGAGAGARLGVGGRGSGVNNGGAGSGVVGAGGGVVGPHPAGPLPPLSRQQRRTRLLRDKKRQHRPSPSQ